MSTTASWGSGAACSMVSIRRSPTPWTTTAGPVTALVVVAVVISDHRRHSAVDKDSLPIDVVGRVRGEPGYGPGQVLHGSPAACRGPAKDPGVERVVVNESLCHFGVDVAGGDAVDLQSLGCPLGRHGTGEVAQSALGCRVGADGGPGEV